MPSLPRLVCCAGAVIVTLTLAACDSSPVLDELQYGIVTLVVSGEAGALATDAVGFFYRAERAPLPESDAAGAECTIGPISTAASPEPGFVRISAGDSIVVSAGGARIRLRAIAEPRRMRYARDEDPPLPVAAGQEVLVTVPGAAGAFPPMTVSANVPAIPVFAPIGVPDVGAPLTITWSPAGDATTRIQLVLRYGPATTATEQLVCLVPDTGSIDIPAEALGNWRSAGAASRTAFGRRWRSALQQSGGNVLALYFQLDRTITVSP
jgi:hypothetical protein